MKQKKSRFLGSFFLGLLIPWICIISSLLCCAGNETLFESAEQHNPNAQIMLSAEEVQIFSGQTIHYLTGKEEKWQPTVPFDIPQSFLDHMARMRNLFHKAVVINSAAVILYAALFFSFAFTARFLRNTYVIGTAISSALFFTILAWALLDFRGFWKILHQSLITDGIFSAAEPIMQLFPVSLFQSYILPFVLVLLFCFIMFALIPLLIVLRLNKGNTAQME